MVQAYWHIGTNIVTAEQEGHARAAYGSQLLQELSNRLTKNMVKGLVSVRSEISDSSIWFILTFKFTTQ